MQRTNLGRFFLQTQRVFIAPCGWNFAVKVRLQTAWLNSPTFSFHLAIFSVKKDLKKIFNTPTKFLNNFDEIKKRKYDEL